MKIILHFDDLKGGIKYRIRIDICSPWLWSQLVRDSFKSECRMAGGTKWFYEDGSVGKMVNNEVYMRAGYLSKFVLLIDNHLTFPNRFDCILMPGLEDHHLQSIAASSAASRGAIFAHKVFRLNDLRESWTKIHSLANYMSSVIQCLSSSHSIYISDTSHTFQLMFPL